VRSPEEFADPRRVGGQDGSIPIRLTISNNGRRLAATGLPNRPKEARQGEPEGNSGVVMDGCHTSPGATGQAKQAAISDLLPGGGKLMLTAGLPPA
jgi:hypothetical protein